MDSSALILDELEILLVLSWKCYFLENLCS